MPRRIAIAVFACLALSGCSALGALGRASAPQDVFEIRAPATLPVARGRPQSIDVVVEVPFASGAFDTDAIMVRPTPNQIQYLPDARWSENAPVMLQTAMVEGLERTGAFRFVGRRPLSVSGDLALVTSLTDFHAEVVRATEPAVVRLTLTARLVREDDAAVLATRRFAQEIAISDTSTEAIVAGHIEVARRALSDLTEWVLASRGVTVGSS